MSLAQKIHMLSSIVLSLVCLGCTDKTPVGVAVPSGMPGLLGTFECSVDLREGGRAVCMEPGPRGTGEGPSLALLGQNQIKMRSSNNVSDTVAQLFAMDVTAQNLLTYAIGTPDGETKTGLKVFFETGPAVTAYYMAGDTGTVRVRNPDGHQNFTAERQPFHFYDTILPPQAVTAVKRWEFDVPRTVQRFGFTVRVFTATPRERRVGLQAPEGRPSWFYQPERSVPCTGLLAGSCLPDVVTIQFAANASQEERQSAIEHISGEVVGGTTGAYHVRIPRDVTLARMRNTLQSLRRLPQVTYVAPFSTVMGTVDYLEAFDGGSWRQWRLSPDSADGQNWALEQIAAPSAWGCSFGDTLTRIGIVDDGFFGVQDISKQARHASYGYPSSGSNLNDHATRVAGVVAAYGNDSAQIAGVMWRSKLVMRDVAVDTAGNRFSAQGFPMGELWPHVRKAGRDGAKVINLSLGFRWPSNPALEPDSLVRLGNEALVKDWFRNFRLSMDSLAAEGIRPLIVFSAGNQGVAGIDTRWNVARIAADSSDQFGQRYNVLIVGATNRQKNLAPFTNRDSLGLIAIAAPGEGVFVIHGNASIDSADASRTAPYTPRTGTGTSFAAPHVTGVAGLLFSFDPRLSAGEVKQLILDGATAGGRRAGGVPILNAHESLKLAARRSGAPLCGNRMWSIGGALRVERATGPETLDSLPTGYIRRFDAMHGGKRVRLLTWDRRQFLSELTYENNAWRRGPAVRYDSAMAPIGGSGGGFNSSHRIPGLNPPYLAMYSHGRDSVVQLREVLNGSGWVASASLTLVHSGGTRSLDPITVPFWVGNSPASDCWVRRMDTGNCVQGFDYIEASSNASFTGAFSPMGDSLYVAVRRSKGGGWFTEWEPCPTAPAGDTIRDGVPDDVVRECRPHVQGTGTDSTWIYGIDIRTGRSRLIWSGASALEIWAVSEDGKEFVTRQESGASSHRIEFYVYQPKDEPYYEMRHRYLPQSGTSECALQFRAAQTGTPTYVAVNPQLCPGLDIDGMGAPSLAPGTQ